MRGYLNNYGDILIASLGIPICWLIICFIALILTKRNNKINKITKIILFILNIILLLAHVGFGLYIFSGFYVIASFVSMAELENGGYQNALTAFGPLALTLFGPCILYIALFFRQIVTFFKKKKIKSKSN